MKTWHEHMTSRGLDSYDNYGGSTEHKDMLVSLSRSRDSDLLSESNFEVALKKLGGESDSVQIHRFGHWACGWLEHILIDPKDEKAVDLAKEIESSLEDYPILDEEHHSEMEYKAQCESIEQAGCPSELVGDVFTWLWDNDQGAFHDDCYVDDDSVKTALIHVAPNTLDPYDIADKCEDSDVAYDLIETMNNSEKQFALYAEILPESAKKYEKVHKEGVANLMKELHGKVNCKLRPG